ncbi:MAG TPA: alginate export family protein [Bryobacteraceae bacterium]|jgi:hypothetical protein|nr:alginate export family protein [Bryobacteraceae bacterium]
MRFRLCFASLLFCIVNAASGQTQGAQVPAASAIPPWLTPSTEIDKSLPSWLTFSGQYRIRAEGYSGGGYSPTSSDAYLLSQLQLNLSIHPTPWLRFFAQGMDARSFEKLPAVAPFQNTWDIRLAYVELGDMEKSTFGLRVGRQELMLGDQRLVGNAAWTNTEHSFDAVRGAVRYHGYRLDLFASSIVNPVTGTWDHHQQGNNLHGLYGGIDKFAPYITIEPYILRRLQPSVKNEEGVVANLDEKVSGARAVGKLPHGVDYGVEMVREFGSLAVDNIQSWAGHWVAGKTFATRLTPRAFFEYNFASGDKNPKDAVRGTFDQLYPSGHDLYGVADQVGWRNIKDVRTGIGIKPRSNVTANFEYNNFYLASATDALYNAAGAAVARSADGAAGTHVGQEFDGYGTWTVSRPLLLGAGVGHILPAEFLKNTTKGNPYTYPYVMAVWKF